MLTPKSVQDRFIARKFAGQSNREIARQLGLHHGTVGKILSQAEVQVMLNEYRQSAIELVPKAIKVCSYRLDRKDGKNRHRSFEGHPGIRREAGAGGS